MYLVLIMIFHDFPRSSLFAVISCTDNCLYSFTVFLKHSKSADLLRKSLLSTLRFGRCKTNIHWMFCISYLARPKLKGPIVQARTTFRAFAPGINRIKYAYFPYCPPRYRSPPRRSPGSVPGSGSPVGYPERRSHHFSAHRSCRRTWPQY